LRASRPSPYIDLVVEFEIYVHNKEYERSQGGACVKSSNASKRPRLEEVKMDPRKYPFVMNISDYFIRELGKDMGIEILTKDPWIVELSLKRLEDALAEGISSEHYGNTLHEEVASFYLVLALANSLGPRVLERIIAAEAERAKHFIEREDMDSLIALAERLGLKVLRRSETFPWYVNTSKGTTSKRVLNLALSIKDYLISISGTEDRRLFLQNSFVKGGLVFLDRERFQLVLIERIKKRIKELAISLSEVKIEDELLSRAKEIVSKYLKREKVRMTIPEAFPPCISSIVEKAREKGLISLDVKEGILLALFLSVLGDLSLVKKLFFNDPYIDSFLNLVDLVSKNISAIPRCDRLKELGLCQEECTERTPFHAYLKKVKKIQASTET
jgi:hypothetical protein